MLSAFLSVLAVEASVFCAEGNETVTNCNRLKMRADDGKMRLTDCLCEKAKQVSNMQFDTCFSQSFTKKTKIIDICV